MQYNCNITCKTKSQSELESDSRNWNTTISGFELPNSSWPTHLRVYDKPCEFPFLIGEQEYYEDPKMIGKRNSQKEMFSADTNNEKKIVGSRRKSNTISDEGVTSNSSNIS